MNHLWGRELGRGKKSFNRILYDSERLEISHEKSYPGLGAWTSMSLNLHSLDDIQISTWEIV